MVVRYGGQLWRDERKERKEKNGCMGRKKGGVAEGSYDGGPAWPGQRMGSTTRKRRTDICSMTWVLAVLLVVLVWRGHRVDVWDYP